jgi:hypothetical protein
MPIIPSDWSGQKIVNATGLSGSGGFPVYAYAKSIEIIITDLDIFIDLIGFCPESINREVSLNLISGSAQLFFINGNGSYELITKEYLTFNTTNSFVDATLGRLGLSIKCNEITELFLGLRWDKNIAFDLYAPGALPPTFSVILESPVVTFANFIPDQVETFTVRLDRATFDDLTDGSYFVMATPQQTFNNAYEMGGVSIYSRGGIYGDHTPYIDDLWEIYFNDFIAPTDYNPNFKFSMGYNAGEYGDLIDYNYTLDVTYDEIERVFLVQHNGVTLLVNGSWPNPGTGGMEFNLPLRNKQYQFTVLFESVVTISLKTFYGADPYLFLLDSNSEYIDESDARLSMTLIPGNYIIEATTVLYGKSDSFQLRVSGKVSNLVLI